MRAARLIARVREELTGVEQQLRRNPWLTALEEAALPPEALRAFAGEQLQVIPSDLRSFVTLAQRFAGEEAEGYLRGMVDAERAALPAIGAFATAVGLVGAARACYEPQPGCQAYPSYLARLARDGSAAEVAGAMLVNLEAWGSCCVRMRTALISHYGLSEDDCAFFALFSGPTGALERDSLEVIDAGLDHGVDPALIARASRLLQAYELQFWLSLSGQADRPAPAPPR